MLVSAGLRLSFRGQWGRGRRVEVRCVEAIVWEGGGVGGRGEVRVYVNNGRLVVAME